MERFVGVLIEHFAGKFPTWLSPTQVHIITISEKHTAWADEVAAALKEAGVRIEADTSDATIGKKIRTHRKMQPPYLLIIGDEEVTGKTISLRGRNNAQRNGIPLAEFVAEIRAEIESKSLQLNLTPPAPPED
jgi:threonyl-tRNA synthetase